MSRTANPAIAEMPGPAALPRRSGELVFHDAWERRVFALAVALCEHGHYTWDDFRDHLIAEIAAAEQTARTPATDTSPPHPPGYYESWLAALEKLLAERGVVT